MRLALIITAVIAAWFALALVLGVAIGKTIKACRKGPGR